MKKCGIMFTVTKGRLKPHLFDLAQIMGCAHRSAHRTCVCVHLAKFLAQVVLVSCKTHIISPRADIHPSKHAFSTQKKNGTGYI